MKFITVAALAGSVGLVSASPTPVEARSTVQGFDISSFQPKVDFKAAYGSGARFVIIKVSLSYFAFWTFDDALSMIMANFTTGDGGTHLQGSYILYSLHWCYCGWPYPWRLSLCSS